MILALIRFDISGTEQLYDLVYRKQKDLDVR
jgi:hypothetical protein